MALATVDLYVPPVLFVVGVTCNIIVMVIMRRRFFCKVSTSVYISFNAFFDILSLILALPAHWLHVNFPEVIYKGQNADVMCQFLHFTGWLTSDLGIILTVAMTLERAVAVKYPMRATVYCTTKRAKTIIAILVFVIVIKDVHFLIQSRSAKINSQSRMCELDLSNEVYKYFNDVVWTHLHNVFLGISFFTIIVSNIVIVRAVQSSGSFTSLPSMTSSRNVIRSRTSVQRGKQLTAMLVSDSITIVICTLPFAIYSTVSSSIQIEDLVNHWTFSVCFYLLYVNRCANFFLYCISGQRFRQALLDPCRRRKPGSSARMAVYATERSSEIYTRTNTTDNHFVSETS